jgi:porphobilinogen deaminase
MTLSIAVESKYIYLKNYISAQLENLEVESEIIFSANPFQVLLQEEAAVVVQPLQDCALEHFSGILISALSERKSAANALLIRKSSVQEDGILGMPKSGKIGVKNNITQSQLRHIFTNCSFIINENETNLLADTSFDAIVIPEFYLPFLDTTSFNIYPLQVSEFVPPVGQGVLAWLCFSDDLTTRRLLKKIHHSPTTKKTNVERTILKRWTKEGISGLAHCEQDNLENYHLHTIKIGENKELIQQKKSSPTLASWASFA